MPMKLSDPTAGSRISRCRMASASIFSRQYSSFESLSVASGVPAFSASWIRLTSVSIIGPILSPPIRLQGLRQGGAGAQRRGAYGEGRGGAIGAQDRLDAARLWRVDAATDGSQP